MTKPITSVAAMMLYEEGGFELTDPLSAFIPSFAGVRVYAGGSDLRQVTVPATEPPGTEWNYSVATDVLGRVIEVVSGQPSTSSSPRGSCARSA